MKEPDWEIASHGLKWIEYKDYSAADEGAHLKEAIRIHREVTGERPLGWYTGRCSVNTTKLVMEEGGFLYSSDSYADDLPYWVARPQGGNHLVIPYTLDANDMRFATPQGFNSGEQFLGYLRDSFDFLYEEGRRGSPKMMSVGLHCRLIGRPGRAMALERFLDHIARHDKVWIPRPIDIARHWHKNFPPTVKCRGPARSHRHPGNSPSCGAAGTAGPYAVLARRRLCRISPNAVAQSSRRGAGPGLPDAGSRTSHRHTAHRRCAGAHAGGNAAALRSLQSAWAARAVARPVPILPIG